MLAENVVVIEPKEDETLEEMVEADLEIENAEGYFQEEDDEVENEEVENAEAYFQGIISPDSKAHKYTAGGK